MGSKKLKKAIMSGKVQVRNRTGTEVLIWYRGRDGKRYTAIIAPNATTELAPRLTDAPLLEYSNIEDRGKAGRIEVL